MNEDIIAQSSSATTLESQKLVVIVAMSGNMLLDFSGPADVFTSADQCLALSGSGQGYKVIIASPGSDKTIATNTGIAINCEHSVFDIRQPIDTLIVAGNDFRTLAPADYAVFCQWLAVLDTKRTRRIGSVCGGAFALAEAGLLNGKKATTIGN